MKAEIDKLQAKLDANNKYRGLQAQINKLTERVRDGTMTAEATRRAQQLQLKVQQMPDRVQKVREKHTYEQPIHHQAEVDETVSKVAETDTDDAHLDAEIAQIQEEVNFHIGESEALRNQLTHIQDGANTFIRAVADVIACRNAA